MRANSSNSQATKDEPLKIVDSSRTRHILEMGAIHERPTAQAQMEPIPRGTVLPPHMIISATPNQSLFLRNKACGMNEKWKKSCGDMMRPSLWSLMDLLMLLRHNSAAYLVVSC